MIKSAREAGVTWAQIGEALGITKQAAHDFYRRKVEEQEKYLPELHDDAAARADRSGTLRCSGVYIFHGSPPATIGDLAHQVSTTSGPETFQAIQHTGLPASRSTELHNHPVCANGAGRRKRWGAVKRWMKSERRSVEIRRIVCHRIDFPASAAR